MKPVTVTQLNEYIAQKLRMDLNLRDIAVTGEISEINKSGFHVYLTLKHESSTIRCAIWSSNLKDIPKEYLDVGNHVIALGDISPYAKNGTYTFSIKDLDLVGEGALMAEFNRIKKKLESEGLFDHKHKKTLPEFAGCVGVVTSPDGAAIQDIKKIITSKNSYTDILIFPAIVQGSDAPESIIHGIELANRVSENERKIDVLIVGRGGGSAEDLAAFNCEGVARAVFASEIPIISAVGHESDFSISDFTADVRAETPTAAADMAVVNTLDLKNNIERCVYNMISEIKTKLEYEKRIIGNFSDKLYAGIRSAIKEQQMTIEKCMLALKENDPRNILKKGYAAVTETEGIIISSIEDIKVNADYTIILSDGKFNANVLDKERGAKYE